MEESGESGMRGHVQPALPGDFMSNAFELPTIGSSHKEDAFSAFAEAGGLSIPEPQATNDIDLLKSLMMDDAQTAEIAEKLRHCPGRATETNPGASESSGLNIRCKECLSDEGPGRMGPIRTHYAGSFYCKRCWEMVEAIDPSHKAGSGQKPAAKYNYEVVVGELFGRRNRKKARLLERNEAGLWKIRYMDQKEEDDMPEAALKAVQVANTEDPVESIEELKTMLRTLFADIPKGEPRELSIGGLQDKFRQSFSRRIDPTLFGHKQLIKLMRDARLSGDFEQKDLAVREVQLTCSLIEGETLE